MKSKQLHIIILISALLSACTIDYNISSISSEEGPNLGSPDQGPDSAPIPSYTSTSLEWAAQATDIIGNSLFVFNSGTISLNKVTGMKGLSDLVDTLTGVQLLDGNLNISDDNVTNSTLDSWYAKLHNLDNGFPATADADSSLMLYIPFDADPLDVNPATQGMPTTVILSGMLKTFMKGTYANTTPNLLNTNRAPTSKVKEAADLFTGYDISGNDSTRNVPIFVDTNATAIPGVFQRGDANHSEYSVALWMNPAMTPSDMSVGDGQEAQNIFHYYRGPAAGLAAYRNMGGRIILSIGGSSSTRYFGTIDPIPQNQWTHVAITIRDMTLKIFINGVAAEIGTATNHSSTTLSGAATQQVLASPVNFGLYNSPHIQLKVFTHFYEMGFIRSSVDEFALWNTGLLDNQVQELYNLQAAKYRGLYQSKIVDSGADNFDWENLNISTPVNVISDGVAANTADFTESYIEARTCAMANCSDNSTWQAPSNFLAAEWVKRYLQFRIHVLADEKTCNAVSCESGIQNILIGNGTEKTYAGPVSLDSNFIQEVTMDELQTLTTTGDSCIKYQFKEGMEGSYSYLNAGVKLSATNLSQNSSLSDLQNFLQGKPSDNLLFRLVFDNSADPTVDCSFSLLRVSGRDTDP